MQLADNYYRNYECMVLQDEGVAISKYTGLDGREIAMANNLIWRLNLGPNARQKMVVINHVIHTKSATQYQGETWGHFVPMGQIVKQQMLEPKDGSGIGTMFNIAMVYGRGTFWNKWQRPQERFVDSCPPPREDGLEVVMERISRETGMPNFFLHWERAPPEAWLYLREVSTIRENDYYIRAYPLEWNGCIYLDEATHATPP